MIGCSTDTMSAVSVTGVAPCLIRPLVPSARGSSGEPGRRTLRGPAQAHNRAVISDPERFAASTMTTPSDSPEISRLRRGKSRPRGSQPIGISESAGAGRQDGVEERRMLGRIDAILAARQHRDGPGGEARGMRRRVDAAGEPGGDDKACFAEFARDPLGEFQSRARGVARADDRHHRQCKRVHVAADGQERRRIVDHLQPVRIAGFAQSHQRDPQLSRGGNLSLGVFARADLHGASQAAAPRQRGQRLQRGTRWVSSLAPRALV